jgi:response regulator RpfG family c-di-GMP phosphodiesterase
MASCEHPSQACEATHRRVVLVVEDEALVRLTIADYLRDCGYVVAEAGDANEALEIFASGEPVDVVFTDVESLAPWTGLCSCAGSMSIILASKC